jgi:hypothetical protein
MTCRCTCKAYGGHCDCWFHGSTQARLALGADRDAAVLRAEYAEAERDVLVEQVKAADLEIQALVAKLNDVYSQLRASNAVVATSGKR